MNGGGGELGLLFPGGRWGNPGRRLGLSPGGALRWGAAFLGEGILRCRTAGGA